jgi:hypothetical protein
VLEHHGQLAAHRLQLLVAGGFEHAVFGQSEDQFFACHADGARMWAFQHVDATQKRALARPAGADDADAVSCLRGERDAFEHFMLPVAFVDVFDVKFGAHGGQSVGGNVQKIGGCGAVGSGAEQVAAAQRLVA